MSHHSKSINYSSVHLKWIGIRLQGQWIHLVDDTEVHSQT